MSSDFHRGKFSPQPPPGTDPARRAGRGACFAARVEDWACYSHGDGSEVEASGARHYLRYRQGMGPRTARNDGPDVDDLAVLDDVVGIVHVHSRRGVTGKELDDVTDGDGAVGWWGEAAVLLVKAEIRQIETVDRGEVRGGDRFVSGIDDDPLRRAADHRRQDAQRRLEPSLDTGVETVHQHIGAGLDLSDAWSGGGQPPGAGAASGDDRARNAGVLNRGDGG